MEAKKTSQEGNRDFPILIFFKKKNPLEEVTSFARFKVGVFSVFHKYTCIQDTPGEKDSLNSFFFFFILARIPIK